MPKVTHGHTIGGHSREYQTWANMISRCTREATAGYGKYGGRGISICDRWKRFENFIADMGECPDGCSLDRINNDGDYTPENCRWADRKTQQRNTSRNRWLTVNGATLTIADWADRTGVNRKTIIKRLQLGWDAARAITPRG